MTVNAVIFDIGNVLIEWQPERFYDAEIGEDRRRAMFSAIDLHGMNDVVDRGGDFRDTIYGWAERYPDWAEPIRQWHDRWLDIAGPEIPHSVHLMRALRAKRVPVYALTNFGVGSFAISREKWTFLKEFDRTYVSGQMQMAKPDEDIYAAVEADCGLPPESLLFADDRADNCATAASRGWQVHQFTGPDGWADTLVAKGLLSKTEAAWGS